MTRDPPATDAPFAPCLQVPKCPHTTGQPGQTGQRKRLCCWRTPCPCHPALARPLSDLTTAPPKAPHSAIRAAGCWLLALRALPQNQRATERPLYHKARAARRNTDQEARWRPSDSSFNSIWPRSDQADPVRHSRKRPPGLSREDAMAAPPAARFPSTPKPKTPSQIKRAPPRIFPAKAPPKQACNRYIYVMLYQPHNLVLAGSKSTARWSCAGSAGATGARGELLCTHLNNERTLSGV